MNRIKTTIADILAGADALSVLADKFEEIGPDAESFNFKCAKLAGEAYRRAGNLLEERGYTMNAREAFTKARDCFERAGAKEDAAYAAERRHVNWPASGNIYGD